MYKSANPGTVHWLLLIPVTGNHLYSKCERNQVNVKYDWLRWVQYALCEMKMPLQSVELGNQQLEHTYQGKRNSIWNIISYR